MLKKSVRLTILEKYNNSCALHLSQAQPPIIHPRSSICSVVNCIFKLQLEK